MMHIEQRPEGWTVVDHTGRVMLKDSQGAPLYCGTREWVVEVCNANRLYEVREGNPSGVPGGMLCELVIGTP